MRFWPEIWCNRAGPPGVVLPVNLRTIPVLAAAATVTALVASPVAAAPGAPVAPFDLDGNGRVDVVSGVPSWNGSGAAPDAGAVVVLWAGRNLWPETVVSQATPGVPGDPSAYDRFGTALASADFDRDGYADLAVGAPGDATDIGAGRSPAFGSVTVFYGSGAGIGSRVAQVEHGGHAGFGAALAAADLDGDGWPDLAVGSTGDDPRPEEDYGSGAVVVLRGGPAGFALARSNTVARPDPALASFGGLLAAGDLDGDGDQDLVEGYQGTPHWIDDPPVPGHVTYALGSPSGLGGAVRLSGDRAASLAVGDLTCDGRADIVVGQPLRTTYTDDDAVPRGRVTVYAGTATGPAAAGTRITQATPGVPGGDEHGDLFGADVELSDVDRDGHLDLVIGSPGEDGRRGRLTVLRGVRGGVDRRHAVTLDQASPEIPGKREAGDEFGAEIAMLDVSGDGRYDLVVGSPGENASRGQVTVVTLRGIFYIGRGVRSYTLESIGQRFGGPEKQWGSLIGG
jgi:hypothetical protein